MWLHQKFWHASPAKLWPMLSAAGQPPERYKHVCDIVKLCKQCAEWGKPLNKPLHRTTLVQRFNEEIQLDCFVLLGVNYLLIVDSAFRYKQGCPLIRMDTDTMIQSLLSVWVRYFGPPQRIVSDQGGNLAGIDFGMLCDRLNISRHLGGADASRPARHTITGLVEKHVDICKTHMLKMNAQALDEGLVLSPDELIAETCACSNCMLTFNGVVPVTGVFGIPPRDLFDMENSTPDLGAVPDPADMAARACAVRMHAKAAMLQTLSEVRVARANNTRVHINKVFTPGDLVDLFRRPLLKDAPGWRGPGVLLDLCQATGTCIVKWQGKPWLLNLRFIRPHIGFSALFAAVGTAFVTGKRKAEGAQTHVHLIFADGGFTIGGAPMAAHGQQLTDGGIVTCTASTVMENAAPAVLET